ncbi:hypothetical protein MTO96_040078 [Rhipicephalus appendiculatus]
MRTNPFLYIVELIGTLVLIPTAWKGRSPSSETIITLLPNGATAEPILGGGNWRPEYGASTKPFAETPDLTARRWRFQHTGSLQNQRISPSSP